MGSLGAIFNANNTAGPSFGFLSIGAALVPKEGDLFSFLVSFLFSGGSSGRSAYVFRILLFTLVWDRWRFSLFFYMFNISLGVAVVFLIFYFIVLRGATTLLMGLGGPLVAP